MAKRGRGVYAVINDGGDTDSEITQCRAVFCEWDDRPKEWQIDAWKGLGLPEPTLQVDTGGKSIHNYWVFAEPISVEDWKSLQTRPITLTLIAPSKTHPASCGCRHLPHRW